MRLSDLKGRAVVLNFWAIWCPPCRREMPLLDAVNREYGPQGVMVIGIDVGEPARVVKRYVEQMVSTTLFGSMRQQARWISIPREGSLLASAE